MPIMFNISGFKEYYIKDKILYRKAYITKSESNPVKPQYRAERQIKITTKDGIQGYFLIKNGIRKFHSLKSLRHRLKKLPITNY